MLTSRAALDIVKAKQERRAEEATSVRTTSQLTSKQAPSLSELTTAKRGRRIDSADQGEGASPEEDDHELPLAAAAAIANLNASTAVAATTPSDLAAVAMRHFGRVLLRQVLLE